MFCRLKNHPLRRLQTMPNSNSCRKIQMLFLHPTSQVGHTCFEVARKYVVNSFQPPPLQHCLRRPAPTTGDTRKIIQVADNPPNPARPQTTQGRPGESSSPLSSSCYSHLLFLCSSVFFYCCCYCCWGAPIPSQSYHLQNKAAAGRPI